MRTSANQNRLSGHGLMTTVAVNRIQVAKRRSSRIALNARIGLSGQDREKCTFTMPARATNLNKHGAAIQLNRELSVGSAVVVQNGRGTQASARVIAQVSATQGGVYTYGVEFLEDGGVNDFWGISFPPQA
jgi:autotransporter translocation and assembly factor TamB